MSTHVGQSTTMTAQRIVSALSAAVVISVITIFVEVSFGALIFSGPFAEFVGLGIGLCLAGTLVHALVAALTSSSRNIVATVQDAPVAIIAAVFVSISATLTLPDKEAMLGTGLAVIIVTSALAGLFFWALGRFNLGRLVRFVPYPVVGGFLAGTGYLVIVGGIGVMAGVDLSPALLAPDVLLRWLPGFAYGLLLLLALRRFSQFWVMPLLLVGGVVGFYAVYLAAGGTVATATADGWLLGPFPSGRLWQPTLGLVIAHAHWDVVLANVLKIATAMLVAAISILLNISGLEVLSGEDVDLNRELRWSGIANVAGAVVGGPVGYPSLSFSSLSFRLAGPTRLVGFFTAAIVAVTVVLGASMLSNVPRMLAGGLLVFMGLSFLVEWLVDSWRTLPRLDYALIWVILIVIATIGFLEGVAVGILVAALLFLINYSRIDVVRHAATRTDYASAVQYPPLYEQLLEQRGAGLAILTLQGYIFFGTAHRLVEQITARVEDPSLARLRYLVLDFRLVTGMDTSSSLSFARLKQTTSAKDVHVVLTGIEAAHWRCLASKLADGDDMGDEGLWRIMPTMDEGVAWCEQQMINVFADVGLTAAPKSIIDAMRTRFAVAADDLDWLDLLKPGTAAPMSAQFTTLLGYLDRVDFAEGDVLAVQAEPVQGLAFLEKGTARYATVDDRGTVVDTGVLTPGTFFGVNATYAGTPHRRTVTATGPGYLYCLSPANLARMEEEHPTLAIALHRELATRLGARVGRAEDLVRLLQR